MTTQKMLGMIQFGGTELLFITLSLAITVFWIWMLVDCAKRIGRGDSKQVGWIIAIALTHGFGALAYFLFGRRSPLSTKS